MVERIKTNTLISDEFEYSHSSEDFNTPTSNSLVLPSCQNISEVFNKILDLRECENQPNLTLMLSPSQMILLKTDTVKKIDFLNTLNNFNKKKLKEESKPNSFFSSLRLNDDSIDFATLQLIENVLSSTDPSSLINSDNFVLLLQASDYLQIEELQKLCEEWFESEFKRSYRSKKGIDNVILESIFYHLNIQGKLITQLKLIHSRDKTAYSSLETWPEKFINCFESYVRLYNQINYLKKFHVCKILVEPHGFKFCDGLKILSGELKNQIIKAITSCCVTSTNLYHRHHGLYPIIIKKIKDILKKYSISINTYKHSSLSTFDLDTAFNDLFEIIHLLNVKKLTYLDRQTYFPSFSTHLSKIEHLSITFLLYTTPPIFPMPQLKSLRMTTCPKQRVFLKELVNPLHNLQSLTLNSMISEPLEEVIEILKGIPFLISLDLTGCRIGDITLDKRFKSDPQTVIHLLEGLLT